ncbi:MAG: MOSC domain-containing protein [Puniceicoccaceae bacterium]
MSSHLQSSPVPSQVAPQIHSVQVGRIQPFTRKGTSSAIAKHQIEGRVRVQMLGLSGDEQADKKVHGGPDKAIHAYPLEHYAFWNADLLKDHVLLQKPGAFGENLTTRGLTEQNICIGDRWSIGTVLLEVSQGRQPCWKLDDRFSVKGLCRRVQDTRLTGWYFRVIEPGVLQAGEEITLQARPYPEWSIKRVMDLLWGRKADPELLKSASELPLPSSWTHRFAERARDSSSVSNESARLDGPGTAA